jgi:hypothetical protein
LRRYNKRWGALCALTLILPAIKIEITAAYHRTYKVIRCGEYDKQCTAYDPNNIAMTGKHAPSCNALPQFCEEVLLLFNLLRFIVPAVEVIDRLLIRYLPSTPSQSALQSRCAPIATETQADEQEPEKRTNVRAKNHMRREHLSHCRVV